MKIRNQIVEIKTQRGIGWPGRVGWRLATVWGGFSDSQCLWRRLVGFCKINPAKRVTGPVFECK